MNNAKFETLYRVMYEELTPAMMRRTPMWLKSRIAAALGYKLVAQLSADAWLRSLFTAKRGDITPISIEMFDSSTGGYGYRKFGRPSFYWRIARRVWRGQTKTPEQIKALRKEYAPKRINLPADTFPAATTDIRNRRVREQKPI